MKKLIYLVLTVLIVSCSSDDSSSSSNSSINITPPSWIQGIWLQDLPFELGFEFKTDDFCTVNMSNTYCFKADLEQIQEQNVIDANVEQEITDSYYLLEITIGGNTTAYEFDKVSATEISTTAGGTTTIYIKQ
jgi:hypothetical protein